MLMLSLEQEELDKINGHVYKEPKFQAVRPKTAKITGPRIEARCLNKGHVMEYISVKNWEAQYPDVKNDNICSLCLNYIWVEKSFSYNKQDEHRKIYQDK